MKSRDDEIHYRQLDRLVDAGGRQVAGFRVVEVDSIDSTNSYLLRSAALDGEPHLVVVARHQTAGRGRRNRAWVDDHGESLLFSVSFRHQQSTKPVEENMGAVALADAQRVGIAVAEMARSYGVDAGLKWPNDVVVDDRKMAGVLGETSITGSRLDVVVGCGLNLNWPVAPGVEAGLRDGLEVGETGNPISLSEASGSELDRTEVLDAVLMNLNELLALSRTEVLGRYRSLCITLGRRVRVETEGNDDAQLFVEGEATEIDNQGALVVETADGPRAFSLGDVVHLRHARQ